MAKNLIIEATKRTPSIKCDAAKGFIGITGVSIPNVATPLYAPIEDWLKEYSKNPAKITLVVVNLVHLDTDSSKCIFDLFKLIQNTLFENGHRVELEWYYEDEDLFELGEDYKSLLKIPVSLISVM